MLDRDLKMIAMQMATLLPDDEEMARKTCAFLEELINGYLYAKEASGYARRSSFSGEDSNIARFVGKEPISPRKM